MTDRLLEDAGVPCSPEPEWITLESGIVMIADAAAVQAKEGA